MSLSCRNPVAFFVSSKGRCNAVRDKLDIDVLAREDERQEQACTCLSWCPRDELFDRHITLAMRQTGADNTEQHRELLSFLGNLTIGDELIDRRENHFRFRRTLGGICRAC